MLSQEEIRAFLALLLQFCYDTKTSARCLAKLLELTPNTTAKYLRAARGLGGVERMFHVNVDHINVAILSMNAYAAKHNSYAKIASISCPVKRLTALKDLMAKAK